MPTRYSPYSQIWQDSSSRQENDVSISHMEDQLSTLTILVQQIISLKELKERTCKICISPYHPTDWCPRLQQKKSYKDPYSVGGYMDSAQWSNYAYSDSYSQVYSD